MINEDNIEGSLENSLKKVSKLLSKRIYRLFNKRVHRFDKYSMAKQYMDQPIILYGGGSRLPYINSDEIIIHDNGNRMSLNINRTIIEKVEIERFVNNVNIESTDNSWKSEFYLLVVALGLSYVKHESHAEWFDESNYINRDVDRGELIQHPFNEDCYIYDVFK